MRSSLGWSILECLNHLHGTFEDYVPKIEQAIQQNSRSAGPVASPLLFLESERAFLTQAEPPIGAGSAAPPLLVRTPAASPDRIADQLPPLRARYSAAIPSIPELDLANIFIDGLIDPRVQSLGGIVALLAAYDRRHIWQTERIRRASGFPAGVGGAGSWPG